MRSADLVGLYVRGLSTLLGARAVSVYLPRAPRGSALSHDGPDGPLPELADLAQAERFATAAAADAARLRAAGTDGVELPSRAPGGRLIGIFAGAPERVPDRRGGRAAARTSVHGPELWLGLRTGAPLRPSRCLPRPPGCARSSRRCRGCSASRASSGGTASASPRSWTTR